MRLLLDTHIAVWAATDDERLPAAARRAIEGATEAWASVVTLWEVAIKRSLPHRRSGQFLTSAEQLAADFEASGIKLLPIRPEHAIAVEHLPHLHGDPLDRLLVVQAMTEPLRLVTVDAALAHYSDQVIVA